MSEFFLGQIVPVAFDSGRIPKDFHLCDGTLLPIAQNTALFSLLGTTYGGNGTTTFGLPDLRGRAVMGSNLSQPPMGQKAGTETVTLDVSQLPAHNHAIQATTDAGTTRAGSPVNNIYATNALGAPPAQYFTLPGSAEVALAIATNVVNDGGSGPHSNMQPYLVIDYMIALTGIYPSRQ